jgi:hypothetical protein
MNREFRKRNALAKRRRAKGVTLVWSGLILIALLLIMGLLIDLSRIFLVANQLQNAADASALAGARTVRIDKSGDYIVSRTQAQYIGGLNTATGNSVFIDLNINTSNSSTGDIVIGRYSFTTTPRFRYTGIDGPGLPKPNAMKVVARRIADGGTHQPVSLFFGPIFTFNTANVSRYAIAEAEGGLGAGLLVLSEDPKLGPQYYPPLQFSGNPIVEVTDGAIQVNMPDPYYPVPEASHPTVCADEFNVVSKIDPTDGYDFCPASGGLTLTTGQPKIPDPYRDVPAPVPNPATPKDGTIPSTKTKTFEPGYYLNGIDPISNGFNITFNPGIYIICAQKNNDGLTITGGNVCAKRVMFYIAAAGEYGSKLDATLKVTGGTGNILITEINDVDPGIGCDGNAITYSQGNAYVHPYKGMSIFESRTSDPKQEASVGGGSGLDIRGTLYFPNNHVKLSGGSSSLGIEVVAHTVNIDGTGPGNQSLLINYDGRNRRPAGRAYLVE